VNRHGRVEQNVMSDHLFSGLKVIDCASWIAGPAAATIMSDFGADVIKIEPPGVGDPWRARSASGAVQGLRGHAPGPGRLRKAC